MCPQRDNNLVVEAQCGLERALDRGRLGYLLEPRDVVGCQPPRQMHDHGDTPRGGDVRFEPVPRNGTCRFTETPTLIRVLLESTRVYAAAGGPSGPGASSPGATEITRPRRPRVNATVPAERA